MSKFAAVSWCFAYGILQSRDTRLLHGLCVSQFGQSCVNSERKSAEEDRGPRWWGRLNMRLTSTSASIHSRKSKSETRLFVVTVSQMELALQIAFGSQMVR